MDLRGFLGNRARLVATCRTSVKELSESGHRLFMYGANSVRPGRMNLQLNRAFVYPYIFFFAVGGSKPFMRRCMESPA